MSRGVLLVLSLSLMGLLLLNTWLGVRLSHTQATAQETAVRLFRSEERLRVLTAEWAHLNNPDRIQRLARKYLNMTSLNAWRILSLSDLKAPVQKKD